MRWNKTLLDCKADDGVAAVAVLRANSGYISCLDYNFMQSKVIPPAKFVLYVMLEYIPGIPLWFRWDILLWGSRLLRSFKDWKKEIQKSGVTAAKIRGFWGRNPGSEPQEIQSITTPFTRAGSPFRVCILLSPLSPSRGAVSAHADNPKCQFKFAPNLRASHSVICMAYENSQVHFLQFSYFSFPELLAAGCPRWISIWPTKQPHVANANVWKTGCGQGHAE